MTPILALIFGVLGLAIGEVVKFWQDDANPLLSVGLSVVGGALPLIIDYLRDVDGQKNDRPTEPRPRHPGHHPSRPWPAQYRPPPRRRGWRLLGAILIVLVLGGGAAYGISYGIGYATGNETVLADRLVAPATGKAARVTVKVTKVEVTAHYTKVGITVTNQNRASVTLPLFGNCQLVDESGISLKPGTPLDGLSPISVPPNGTPVSEVITFGGRPPPTKTTLTFSFDTVFGVLSAENSLQVVGIKLKAEE